MDYTQMSQPTIEKQRVHVLKKKCPTCNYLVDWMEDINNCSDDPECPARKIRFTFGRDPEVLARWLAMRVASGQMNEEEVASALLRMKKTDFPQVMLRFATLLPEMKKQAEELRKQAEMRYAMENPTV